jgi:hypothetical protein
MLEVMETEVDSIQDYFRSLEDPRSTINRKHLLGDLIVICICAVIAGADGPKAIGIWALSNQEWLSQQLELPHGIPSHDTLGRLLALLKPMAFQTCFQNWISALTQPTSQDSMTAMPNPQKGIAIDGKALRRSHDRKNNLGAGTGAFDARSSRTIAVSSLLPRFLPLLGGFPSPVVSFLWQETSAPSPSWFPSPFLDAQASGHVSPKRSCWGLAAA